MTNAEKFLKEGASVEEFATEFQKWCIINNNVDTQTYYNEMTGFLNEPSIPALIIKKHEELLKGE